MVHKFEFPNVSISNFNLLEEVIMCIIFGDIHLSAIVLSLQNLGNNGLDFNKGKIFKILNIFGSSKV